MNEVSLVLLLFLFTSRGAARYWGNPRDEIFHPRSRRSLLFKHLPSLLGYSGVGWESFFVEGEPSRMLPLSTFLDAYGVRSESSLAKEGCSGRRLITSSRPTTLVLEVWVGDEFPGAKFRRSVMTECSPSSIFEGRGRGITGRI